MSLKLAIIGFGKSANRYHLLYLLKQKNFEVKYIFDLKSNLDLERQYADYSINFVTDIETILADKEVTVVSLCTPPNTHYELGKRFLESGKNVVIEKPFCENITDAIELQTIAKKKNLLVQPYQNRRFDSDYLTLKKVLDLDYLGDLIEIESQFNYYRPDSAVKTGGQIDGAFYGMGVHLIDQMVALFGEPERVDYDLRAVQNKESQTEDFFDIHLFYDPLKIRIKSSPLTAMEVPRFVVHGTNGSYIKMGPDQQENDLKAGLKPGDRYFGEDTPDCFGQLKYLNASGEWILKSVQSEQGSYGFFYDSLHQALEYNQPKLVSDEEAKAVLQILQNGYH